MVSSSWNQPTNIMESPHRPLLPNVNKPTTASSPARISSRQRSAILFLIFCGILDLAFVVVGPNGCKKTYEKQLSIFITNDDLPVVSDNNSSETSSTTKAAVDEIPATVVARGVSKGVSAKSFRPLLIGLRPSYSWTNQMLNWQRSGFHFQPARIG